jgi:hypothetical protein
MQRTFGDILVLLRFTSVGINKHGKKLRRNWVVLARGIDPTFQGNALYEAKASRIPQSGTRLCFILLFNIEVLVLRSFINEIMLYGILLALAMDVCGKEKNLNAFLVIKSRTRRNKTTDGLIST